jgi:heptosyltransferase-2
LARFAIGHLGFAHGHSIDRREVSQLFVPGGGETAEARAFFGAFEHIYSFFAADDARFVAALGAAAGGRISCYPFRPAGDGHVARCYLDAIGEASHEAPESTIELSVDELDAARDRLGALGLAPGEFVALFPGSGSHAKNWPTANFTALARRLRERTRALIVLGPAEADATIDFGGCDAPLVKDLELGEVAAIARMARAFVGNDSGVSHLAAAAGGRGVVLFGPTDPARWRPLGAVRIIRREPIASITVEEVEAALKLEASL